MKNALKNWGIATAISLVALAGTATPIHAQTVVGQPAYHHVSKSLQFAYDYARAADTFEVGGRTFLVQANPQTSLEIAAKRYWIWSKIADLQKQILTATW